MQRVDYPPLHENESPTQNSPTKNIEWSQFPLP